MTQGTVTAIALAPEPGVLPCFAESTHAHAGRGLEGEYHLAREGEEAPPGGAITLIAEEALAEAADRSGVPLTHEESRRNVLTRGIDLNALVGRRFRVGEVLCAGVELCEPCARLQKMTRPGVLRGYVHRAGLRADVLSDGRIAVGDAVVPLA